MSPEDEARRVERDLEWRAGVLEAREESILELERLLLEEESIMDLERLMVQDDFLSEATQTPF